MLKKNTVRLIIRPGTVYDYKAEEFVCLIKISKLIPIETLFYCSSIKELSLYRGSLYDIREKQSKSRGSARKKIWFIFSGTWETYLFLYFVPKCQNFTLNSLQLAITFTQNLCFECKKMAIHVVIDGLRMRSVSTPSHSIGAVRGD